MNKYLLLRDNKQSGPYSVDELATYGLKPYDLVWLEGRSAAWRYPSEIEELKPFAPVVEEQPFDRFYKKPEVKTAEPPAKDHTSVKKDPIFLKEESTPPSLNKPAEQIRELKANASKKIHVSLPVSKTGSTTGSPNNSATAHEEEVRPVALPPAGRSHPAYIGTHEGSNHVAAQTSTVSMDTRNNFDEADKKWQQKEVAVPPMVTGQRATVSKLLFRSVAAACLLLGGALIGLIINYNSQQRKFQQLNELVQEIKQQDNPISSIPVKKEISDVEATTSEQAPAPVTPIYKEDIQIPAATDSKVVKPKTKMPAALPADTQIIEPIPAPAVPAAEEPAPKSEKISPELARKNLWQLVSVDHNKFKTGVFGGISNLELKISNKSLYQLEQVEVEVKYFGPEKKVVNTQKIVFENVSPGEQLSVPVPKSSRGIQIDYSIKKISTKELGLAHAGT